MISSTDRYFNDPSSSLIIFFKAVEGQAMIEVEASNGGAKESELPLSALFGLISTPIIWEAPLARAPAATCENHLNLELLIVLENIYLHIYD